jgi:uncharacterized protein (TIGR02246 family)
MIIALLLGASLLSGCGEPSTSPSSSSLTNADIEAITAVNLSYASAWLLDDRELILSLFTDEAVLLPHHGDPPVIGVAAIRGHFWPADAAPFQITSFTMDPVEISGSGDHAATWGKVSIAFTFEVAGEVISYANSGNYLMVFKRNTEDQWHIARYIWNDPLPLER